MKTKTIRIDSSNELKIPYVCLVRCSLEEINSYKPKPEGNSDSLIESGLKEEGNNKNLSVDWNRPYVLLERLSPNDIQNLLVKKQ